MSIPRSLSLLAATSILAFAQEPPADPVPPPPAVPIPADPDSGPLPPPGVPGDAPGAQPAVGLPGREAQVPLGETRITEPIDEPKLSGDSLAGLYQKYTGRRVIVPTAAAAAEFRFVQDASPANPLTYAEAAELLRKAAVLENFVFVQHPQDSNLDILTLATGGPRPTNVDISVFNENRPLPETDVVITYVMTLNHIKPDQALNIFTQIIGQFGAYGSIASVPNASAVVITEKASLIKSLIDLQKTIDVPGSVQSTKFIKVDYSDVTELATTLSELLTAQQGAQGTAGVQRTGSTAPQGAPPGVMPDGGGGGGGGEETPVQILPEPRTNRIFTMGRPVDILFVESLIREFDVPSSERTFMRRKLRFLTVSEFLPIASNAISRAFSGDPSATSGTTTGGGGGGTRTQQSRTQQTGFGGARGSTGANFGGGTDGFGGGGMGGGGLGGGSRGGGSALGGDPNVSSAPESMLVGRTLLVADNITNSIVAQGPPSALEIVERLLDQIDVRPDQIMISTVIGQLSLTNDRDTGFDYLYRGSDVIGRAGGGFAPILPILPGVGSGDDPGTGEFNPGTLAGSGLRVYGSVGDFDIFFRALQSRTDFTVLSRPSIFVSNNQTGSISSGERIAIPTSTNSFSAGGSSTNIQYQDVVLKLEVRPLVNSPEEITLQIALLNDEQNGIQTIAGAGPNGADLEVPRISTREILTNATIPNNNTIVLGGLIINRDNQTRSGIPILSDIPGLGRLFSSTIDKKDRSELMIFIQPSIVSNDRSLVNVQQDMDDRYKITPDARGFAEGGVLPGPGEIETSAADKGGRYATPYAAAGSDPLDTVVRPTIRPVHRR